MALSREIVVWSEAVTHLLVSFFSRTLAEAYQRLERFDEAKVAGKTYLDLSSDAQNQFEIQRAITTLANIYSDNAINPNCREDRRNSIADKARRYFLESITTIPADCDKIVRLQMESRSLTNLCRLECFFANEPELTRNFEKARKIIDTQAFHNDAFNLFLTMTQFSIEKGEEERSLSFLKRCSVELEKLRSERSSYEIWNSEATIENIRCHVSLEDYKKALLICSTSMKRSKLSRKELDEFKHIKLCLNKLQKRKIQLDNAVCRTQKSNIFEYNADIFDQKFNLKRKAVEAYTQSLRYADKEDSSRIAALHYSLGAVLEDMRRWKEAKEHYTKELKLSGPSEATTIAILRCTLYAHEPFKNVSHLLDSIISLCSTESIKISWKRAVRTSRDQPSDELLDLLHEEKDHSEGLNLSDDSSDEEIENMNDQKHEDMPRRAARAPTNKMGETKLQELVKEPNNLEKVKDELRRPGYPVNHQDKCGYAALHDACFAGESEYVKALLDAGANVNVTNKDNVTPLMDACIIGSPQIIQMLLDRKANLKTKEVKGWSAADYLRHHLNKHKDSLREDEAKALKAIFLSIKSTQSTSKEKKGILLHDEDMMENDAEEDFFVDDIIEARPKKLKNDEKPKKVKLEDNHRIDDLVLIPRKKLTQPVKASHSIRSGTTHSLTEKYSNKRPTFLDEDEDDEVGVPPVSLISVNSQPKRPRLQASEVERTQPKTVETIPAPTLPSPVVGLPSRISDDEQHFSLVVKIAGSVFRILVPKTASVEDLMKKSAQRFLESHGKEPILRLFDSFEAELHPNDKLMHVILANQPVVITSVVKGWILPNAAQNYLRITANSGMYVEDIYQCIVRAEVDERLTLDYQGLASPFTIDPALKAIQVREGLQELSLVACKLGTEQNLITSLCDTLPCLKQLSVMDLSSNALTKWHVKDLQLAFEKASWCPALKSLKLSYNSLDDSVATNIAQITENCASLSHLYLSSCHLSKDFPGRLCVQSLSCLKVVDLSYNRLGVKGMQKVLNLMQTSPAVQQLFLDGCIKQPVKDDKDLLQAVKDFIEMTQNFSLEFISVKNNSKGLRFPNLYPHIKSK